MFRIASIFALTMALSGCASHQYSLPPNGGDSNWSAKPNSAVIFIGIYSEKNIVDIAGKNESTNDLASALYPSDLQNVIALHRKVGESFQLEKVFYSGSRGSQHYFQFKNLPTLVADKPGLYYYGKIELRNGAAQFREDQQAQMVKMARYRFGYLFEQLQPVNFN